jgi:hypothetical protein
VAYKIGKIKTPFTFQDPASCRGETSSKDASKKRSQEVRESEIAVSSF